MENANFDFEAVLLDLGSVHIEAKWYMKDIISNFLEGLWVIAPLLTIPGLVLVIRSTQASLDGLMETPAHLHEVLYHNFNLYINYYTNNNKHHHYNLYINNHTNNNFNDARTNNIDFHYDSYAYNNNKWRSMLRSVCQACPTDYSQNVPGSCFTLMTTAGSWSAGVSNCNALLGNITSINSISEEYELRSKLNFIHEEHHNFNLYINNIIKYYNNHTYYNYDHNFNLYITINIIKHYDNNSDFNDDINNESNKYNDVINNNDNCPDNNIHHNFNLYINNHTNNN
uniref:Uncharacterized protein n=1 Tax=Plectus sambesii TaxID=2011161 RepID=A0A914V558_9BILA